MTKKTKLVFRILYISAAVLVVLIAVVSGWYGWQKYSFTPPPQPSVYQAGNIVWTLPAGWQVAAQPIAYNVPGKAVTDAAGQRVAVLYCPALTAQGDKFWEFTVQQKTYNLDDKKYNVSWYEGLPSEDGKAHNATAYTTHININGPEKNDSCTLIAVGDPWAASQAEKRAVFEGIYQQIK